MSNLDNNIINIYREIFEDYNKDYRHYADICWRIKLILSKDINKLSEKESLFRLLIEII